MNVIASIRQLALTFFVPEHESNLPIRVVSLHYFNNKIGRRFCLFDFFFWKIEIVYEEMNYMESDACAFRLSSIVSKFDFKSKLTLSI